MGIQHFDSIGFSAGFHAQLSRAARKSVSNENLLATFSTKHGSLEIRRYTSIGAETTSLLKLDDKHFAHLIESGFDHFETDDQGGYRWSSGTRSVFNAFLRSGVEYRMDFEAQAFRVQGRQQTVSISINDTYVSTMEIASSWETYTLKIPPLVAGKLNRITLSYGYAESPFALGRSNDKRKLGVRFRDFRFSTAEDQGADHVAVALTLDLT